MRYIAALLLTASGAVSACAQVPSFYTSPEVQWVGPYQPHPFSARMYYYNPSAPAFPVYGGGYGYRRYLAEENAYELRRIRRAVESDAWYRGR
jgi:hypothetical protein